MLTVDGERGRRFRLAHHVLRHAGVGADVGRDESTDLQGVIFTDLVSGEQEVARIAESSKDMDKREEGGLNQGAGGGEAYLPLGRSPSSFLQRTVGTGSPRASHLNSTLWSTNTTWLLGRRTKLGRSEWIKANHQLKSKLHITDVYPQIKI